MDIIGRRKIWYLISLILIVPGILALIFWGINTGLDFKGGSLLDIEYLNPTAKEKVIDATSASGLKNITIQPVGNNGFILRTTPLTQEDQKKLTEELAKAGEFKQNRFETVGPTVSNELKKKSIIAIIIASLAIVIYIAFAFRKVPRPASSWRFGASAVFALIHDILFVVGAFAIFGHYFGYEVDSLFISALLTVMGFSVHDTIVVFDRIRENLRKSPSLSFETNVNNSILQTLNRSLNTSFTVLIVLFSLFVLGGQTLRPFILALLLGVAIGTYSSIFNATPLLVSWQNWSLRRMSRTKEKVSS